MVTHMCRGSFLPSFPCNYKCSDLNITSIFNGLNGLHTGTPSLNVAFANFARIWDGVLGSNPGYKAFGYTNSSSCLTGDQGTVGECDDPKHYFYWIEGWVHVLCLSWRLIKLIELTCFILFFTLDRHPSNETMRIMADYVEEVLVLCTVPWCSYLYVLSLLGSRNNKKHLQTSVILAAMSGLILLVISVCIALKQSCKLS